MTDIEAIKKALENEYHSVCMEDQCEGCGLTTMLVDDNPLAPLLLAAVEMAEFYADMNNADDEYAYLSQETGNEGVLDHGDKARAFLDTLRKALVKS